jgi:hypothetical protein
VSKISAKIDETIFHLKETYVGGTAKNGVFNFVYKISRPGYQVETVDFNNKTIVNKQIFEIPREEKLLTSFSDNNVYYNITANNKTSELVFYILTENGESIIKKMPFKIPETKNKDKNTISEYLDQVKVVKKSEEPGLESVVQPVKLFSSQNKLTFVVNNSDDPTRLFEFNLKDFSYEESVVDHSSLLKQGKSKSFINSFLFDDRIFSIILNKSDITIAVYDTNGAVLKSFKINEETSSAFFSRFPVKEVRNGNKSTESDVDDMRRLIKALTKGTEGITVYNHEGHYILTAGTYDFIQRSSGGTMDLAGIYTKPEVKNTMSGPTFTGGSYVSYFKPGKPSYTSTSARYYTTTYFKLLLDSSSLNTVKGKMPTSVNAQIKDFINETDEKAKATNQFALANGQYYGYFDKESSAYVIEQIKIRK